MNYREQVSQEAEEVAENRSSNNDEEREELDQIDVDLGSTPFVKFTPTTLPTFTFPEEDEGNPIILFKNNQRIAELGDAAENDEGRDLRLLSTRYLGLVVDDIAAVTDEDEGFDETIILDTNNDSTDYRIFDASDDETTTDEVYNADGEVDGIEVTHGGRTYKGEEVGSIDGRSILVVDRTASTSVARTLDVRGGPTAGMDEETGNVNGGLVEYFPSDTDYPDNGRYARPFVELRPDMFGERAGIMVTRRSEVDEDFAEAVAENEDRNDMLWYSVFDMDTGESLERGNYGEPTAYTYLEENFDPEVGRLPDEDWAFVEQYVEAGMPDDEETILENIEAQSADLSDDPDTERMVELIQAGAGQD
jgi:hypothetical protein